MIDPREHGTEPDVDAEVELVKDLDVDDDQIGDIAGGSSSGASQSHSKLA